MSVPVPELLLPEVPVPGVLPPEVDPAPAPVVSELLPPGVELLDPDDPGVALPLPVPLGVVAPPWSVVLVPLVNVLELLLRELLPMPRSEVSWSVLPP